MTIPAKISAYEVTAQIQDRFVSKYLEGILVNAPGVSYTPGLTSDSNFLSSEVTIGAGGYDRAVFRYLPDDVSGYADSGVGLNRKGTIFAHDGSSTPINFTHAVLVWGTGNTEAVEAFSILPTLGNSGTYEGLVTETDGNGVGLTFNLTVTETVTEDELDDEGNVITPGGEDVTTFTWQIASAGRNYQVGDEVTINPNVMQLAGVTNEISDGGAQTVIFEVSDNPDAGQIVAVAKTQTPVILDGGNEAAFYWDVKTFGFSNEAPATTE